MFDKLSLPLLALIFVGAGVAVWLAGIRLSNTSDILSQRWKLGEALGGLILLAIVTNLPEIAITASGALQNNIDLAVGNILGGIGVQTVVLVVLDVWGVGRKGPLTYEAASLQLVLEGVLVIAVLAVAVMGTQLPANLIFARMTPESLLIAGLWVVGLRMIASARKDLPWKDKGDAPEGQNPDDAPSDEKKKQDEKNKKTSTGRAVAIFAASAAVTLVCGVLLERSGDAISKHIGMSGVLFGATVLAAATSLPEVSTGLASMKMGDYQLAISDIFGGNAFLPVLFLLATLLSGKAVLPHAQKSDIYLTAVAMLLTVVYIVGLIFRCRKQVARMGIDSLVVLILYGVSVLGLVAVSQAK